MPLPVVGYIRVSTGKREQLRSIEGQEFQMLELGCDRVIKDVVTGSGSKRRPGWEELRLLVARRAVREIRFVDLSRLARDGSDQQLLEECWVAGVRVVDARGAEWENKTPGGLISSGVLSVVNKAYSRMLSLKVQDGLDRRRRQGYMARANFPFGYRHVEGKAEADPETWEKAAWLVESLIDHEMNFSGTIAELPDDFGWFPTPKGLRMWIENPMLRGGAGRLYDQKTKTHREVTWGVAPVLVTQGQWNTIQGLLKRRAARGGSGSTRRGSGAGSNNIHLLTGLIRCDSCGKNLCWHTNPGERNRYACHVRRCKWFGKGIAEIVVKEAAANALAKRAEEMAELCQTEQQLVNPEVVKLEEQLQALEALHSQGVQGLSSSMVQLRNQLAELQMPAGLPILDETLQMAFSDPDAFLQAPDELLRPILLHWLERVEYQGTPRHCRVVLR